MIEVGVEEEEEEIGLSILSVPQNWNVAFDILLSAASLPVNFFTLNITMFFYIFIFNRSLDFVWLQHNLKGKDIAIKNTTELEKVRWTGHIGDWNSQGTGKRNKIIKSTLFKKKVELKVFMIYII